MGAWTTIRTRYMRDDVGTRLGGLAANLLRIRSYASHPDRRDVVFRLVRESALFIEWTACDVNASKLTDLATLQRQLVSWHNDWQSVWEDNTSRASMAREAGEWSQRLLEMSGLLRERDE